MFHILFDVNVSNIECTLTLNENQQMVWSLISYDASICERTLRLKKFDKSNYYCSACYSEFSMHILERTLILGEIGK